MNGELVDYNPVFDTDYFSAHEIVREHLEHTKDANELRKSMSSHRLSTAHCPSLPTCSTTRVILHSHGPAIAVDVRATVSVRSAAGKADRVASRCAGAGAPHRVSHRLRRERKDSRVARCKMRLPGACTLNAVSWAWAPLSRQAICLGSCDCHRVATVSISIELAGKRSKCISARVSQPARRPRKTLRIATSWSLASSSSLPADIESKSALPIASSPSPLSARTSGTRSRSAVR